MTTVYNENMKKRGTAAVLAAVFVVVLSAKAGGAPLFSQTWGFSLDIPEGCELSEGDGKSRFSFVSQFGTFLDVTVHTGKRSLEALALENEAKFSGRGERNAFTYNGKAALLSRFSFPAPARKTGQRSTASRFSGWALYLELNNPEQKTDRQRLDMRKAAQPAAAPMLCVMSYGPEDKSLESLHLSALDSAAAGEEDRRTPGPVTEFAYPAGAWKRYRLAGTTEEAWFREGGEKAAQALVDREFAVLRRYLDSPRWQEAWKRFYRAIYRDSFDRLKDAAFILERFWNVQAFKEETLQAKPGGGRPDAGADSGGRARKARIFAEKALAWVQNFRYERDLMGSDFVNLVSAAREGRGDCDSRALLWAVLLEQAGTPSGIMVSREFGHAMGLADIEGEGARFPFKEGNTEYRWMVAETSAKVGIGRIEQKVSEITKWLGIVFYTP
jgi:hypothetical protein